jgi:hypothetical protein
MASLQSRLSSLITAIGTDIKALQARTPTILANGNGSSLSDTKEPTIAVEWRDSSDDSLTAKLVQINPIVSAVIVDRSELWARVKSRTGGASADRLILDSDGKTFLDPPMVTALPTTGPSGGALMDGQECYYLADTAGTYGGPVCWHLKYRSSDSKWYYVGGHPLRYRKLASAGFDTFASGSLATYANLPTAGAAAKVNLPLAGDYLVTIQGLGDAPAVDQQTYLSFKIGATAASDDTAIRWRGNQLQSNSSSFSPITVAAGADLLLQMKVTQLSGRIQECAIFAQPIRVS